MCEYLVVTTAVLVGMLLVLGALLIVGLVMGLRRR